MNTSQKKSLAKNKSTENRFQFLSTEENEERNIIGHEKEQNPREGPEFEPIIMEIGQEDNYIPMIPTQAYVEVRFESSLNFGGSIMRSRAKAHLEDTSKSKEEDIEPQEKKEGNQISS